MIGFLAGSALGIALGILLGRNRFADAALRPLIEIERMLPSPAIVPPLILLLGVDQALKIVVITLAAFAPVFVNTYRGVRDLDETLVLTGRTLGLGKVATILQLVVPSATPSIAAGMRVALSLSLVNAVIAEMISGSSGVGYYLMSMEFAMRAADMYAAIICLAVSGYLLNATFMALERRVLHWYARTTVLEWN
jgi:ABC-type nitrate/sulfonate/bicarbonate transport system permease component